MKICWADQVIFSTTENDAYIFNIQYGKGISMPLIFFEELKESLTCKDFLWPHHLPAQLLTILLRKELIIPKNEIEQYRMRSKRDLIDRIESYHGLLVLPTEQCNFRCLYCNQSFLKGCMFASLVESVKKRILHDLKKKQPFSLGFFGGEPLLESDIVLELGEYAYHEARRSGTRINISMTTNGSLIDGSLARKLLRSGIIFYQITIDGPPDIHNAKRMWQDGSGTFDQVVQGIKCLLEQKSKDLRLTFRINVYDEPIERYIEMLSHRDLSPILFDHRVRCSLTQVFGQNEKAVMSESNLTDIYEAFMGAGVRTDRNTIFPSTFSQLCQAAFPNFFVIGSDGTVYKCSHVHDEEQYGIGFLEADGKIKFNENYIDDKYYTQVI